MVQICVISNNNHNNFDICRGVLQTLVEKHFPAPDRNRIQRLLGLEPPKLKLEGDDDMDGAGGSAGGSKRKPIRQAAQRASKKVRAWSSEEEISEEDRNGAHSSGSEFKLSGSESEDDHHTDEESNVSSDFNPFFSDSDSDAGNFAQSFYFVIYILFCFNFYVELYIHIYNRSKILIIVFCL